MTPLVLGSAEMFIDAADQRNGGRAVSAARRLPRCHFCSTPSIPITRKLAYLLPTSASICFCLT